MERPDPGEPKAQTEKYDVGEALYGDDSLVSVACVTVGDEALIVRPDQVDQAASILDGDQAPWLVEVKVEYFLMAAEDFAALPDWQ